MFLLIQLSSSKLVLPFKLSQENTWLRWELPTESWQGAMAQDFLWAEVRMRVEDLLICAQVRFYYLFKVSTVPPIRGMNLIQSSRLSDLQNHRNFSASYPGDLILFFKTLYNEKFQIYTSVKRNVVRSPSSHHPA